MAAVPVGMAGGDGLLIELGQQNVRNSVVNGLGRGFEQVGEADEEAAFAKPDGGVERGKAAEANINWGDGGARTKIAILVLKDGNQGRRRDGLGKASGPLRRNGANRWFAPSPLVRESRLHRRRMRREQLLKQTQGEGIGMLGFAQRPVLVAESVSAQDRFYKSGRC